MKRSPIVGLAMLAAAGCAHMPGQPASVRANGSLQSRADSRELMDKIVGVWVLRGDIGGRSVVHDVDADWALQGNYVRIREVSRENGENGLPAYEAMIYVGWLASAGHFVCLWLDNTAVASERTTCTAEPAEDALAFEFRDGDGALMIATTFTYHGDGDLWSWQIDNIDAGVRTRFADLTMRRR